MLFKSEAAELKVQINFSPVSKLTVHRNTARATFVISLLKTDATIWHD